MELDVTTVAATILSVPVIIALVNLVKETVGQDLGRWKALLAVVFGVILGAAKYAFLTADVVLSAQGWAIAVFTGLLYGLAASGLWDLSDRVSTTANVTITGTESAVIQTDPATDVTTTT